MPVLLKIYKCSQMTPAPGFQVILLCCSLRELGCLFSDNRPRPNAPKPDASRQGLALPHSSTLS